MKKHYLSAGVGLAAAGYFFLSAAAGRAGDDWEWWLYTPVSCKVTKEVKLDVTGMFRWKNDMKDYYYRSVIASGYYSLLPWMDVGASYWYKESRKSKDTDWVYTNTYVGRINFKYSPAGWVTLKEANRIEYDNALYRWLLRVKPIAEFPLVWLGLKPVKLFVDNEFFFAFDYPDDRDTFSENRVTAGVDAEIAGPVGVSVAYRNVGKKSASTGNWDFANVLVTYAKLTF
ncbi:MAG: DUF2490 domain-containing protein [PVC group bacterium]